MERTNDVGMVDMAFRYSCSNSENASVVPEDSTAMATANPALRSAHTRFGVLRRMRVPARACSHMRSGGHVVTTVHENAARAQAVRERQKARPSLMSTLMTTTPCVVGESFA